MAFSQKHQGKSLVPWFCSAEWHYVYKKIYGQDVNQSTLKEALDILFIWKARTPLLPQGVEGTYIILQAILLNKHAYDLYNLKILIGTSIMRFLNICAANNKQQGTFYATAIKKKIPEWLISLRHDIAHGQNLPSMDVLDRALRFCLEWLHQEYWKQSSTTIKDFVDDTQFECDKVETLKCLLQPLVSHYCHITLLRHPFWNYNSIHDIPDEETRDMFLKEIISLIDNKQIDENTDFNNILQVLWEKIEIFLIDYEDLKTRYQILAELITEDVFISNFEERKHVFNNSTKIPKNFINLWQNMFMNFKTEMFGTLIEKLQNITLEETQNHECKTVAATWILEIGKGLEKCIFVKDILKECSKKGTIPKNDLQNIIEKNLISKFKKKANIEVNPKTEIPDIITDNFKFKSLFLEQPNDYTNIFLSQLLDLNGTLKLPENKTNISELINIFLMDNKDEETINDDTVHNIEEFEETLMETDENVTKESNENTDKPIINTKWRKVTEINFEKCPIGILPWQSSTMNPLLSFN